MNQLFSWVLSVKEPSGYLKSRGQTVPGSDWVRSPHCFIAKESSPASPLLWENAKATSRQLPDLSLSCTTTSTSLQLFFVPGSLTLILESPLKDPSGSSGTPGLVSSTQNSGLSSTHCPERPLRPPPPPRPLAHSCPPTSCWQQTAPGTCLPSSGNIHQSSALTPSPLQD